jgi:hypothetical protein
MWSMGMHLTLECSKLMPFKRKRRKIFEKLVTFSLESGQTSQVDQQLLMNGKHEG